MVGLDDRCGVTERKERERLVNQAWCDRPFASLFWLWIIPRRREVCGRNVMSIFVSGGFFPHKCDSSG